MLDSYGTDAPPTSPRLLKALILCLLFELALAAAVCAAWAWMH